MDISIADIFSFLDLVQAHRLARRGKNGKREVVTCELDLAYRLLAMRERVLAGEPLGTYKAFKVYEPKIREINALDYEGRILQHCLCDNFLAPLLEPRLIYDNAACRVGKGTHFAQGRLSQFLREHYRRYGNHGYAMKCDVRHFFASIDHAVLKRKLARLPISPEQLTLLERVVDSFQDSAGRGLPLGNQSSQWFALYYLDSLDRLAKEKLRLPWYTRYMDDIIVIHPDKDYLRHCLAVMREHLRELRLEFNAKTRLMPLSQGVAYLGFIFRLNSRGKVVRTLRAAAKHRLIRYLGRRRRELAEGQITAEKYGEIVTSIRAHLVHGHTWHFAQRCANLGK